MKLFMAIPEKGYQLEFLYGVVTVRDAASDRIIEVFHEVLDLYQWLEEQLTDDQLQNLVGDMQAFIEKNNKHEEAN